SSTQSFIPLNSGSSTYLAATLDEKRKTQKRQNYNFFIKGHYDVLENLTLEASYAYAPSFSNYFVVNTKNSAFDMLTGGHQVGLKASWDNKIGFFLAQSNFNYMDNSRVNSAINMLGWRASVDKNWTNNLENGTVGEGGYGNVNTKQINFNLKATQDFKPLHFGVAQSKFSTGAEIGYVNAYYERMEDMLFGGTRTDRISPLKANEVCRGDDIACSNGKVYYSSGDWANNNGQYTHALSFYKAGNIALDNVNASAFVENDMKLDFNSYFIRLGEINLRLGARVDYDTYMAKTTLSPRFSLNYILPYSSQKFSTQLTFGANRYYGRNLFTYKLMEARSAFEYTVSRANHNTTFEEIINNPQYSSSNDCYNKTNCYHQNKNDTNFKKLRVPYTDELMGGITQKIYAFILSAKYIYRAGKDEIRKMCQTPDGSFSSYNCTSNVAGLTSDLRFVYTNLGQSSSDVVSLSITNNGGLDFGGIKNSILFAFDWTNVRRNYNDYDTSIDANALNNEMIWWGGEVIRYDMR
ncbi:TonB-dependent receptor, partial [Helicobacter sp. T3_23-1056]